MQLRSTSVVTPKLGLTTLHTELVILTVPARGLELSRRLSWVERRSADLVPNFRRTCRSVVPFGAGYACDLVLYSPGQRNVIDRLPNG